MFSSQILEQNPPLLAQDDSTKTCLGPTNASHFESCWVGGGGGVAWKVLVGDSTADLRPLNTSFEPTDEAQQNS